MRGLFFALLAGLCIPCFFPFAAEASGEGLSDLPVGESLYSDDRDDLGGPGSDDPSVDSPAVFVDPGFFEIPAFSVFPDPDGPDEPLVLEEPFIPGSEGSGDDDSVSGSPHSGTPADDSPQGAGSPSGSESSDDDGSGSLSDVTDYRDILDRLDQIIGLIATPGDAEREEDVVPDEEVVDADLIFEGAGAGLFSSGSVPDLNLDQGVVVFTGSVSSYNYPAVFSLADADYLSVLDDGTLINTGSANITGRLYDASFDTGDYDVYLITLLPFFNSNTINTIYGNGCSSFVTHYYQTYSGSSYRLASQNSYSDFIVENRYMMPADGYRRYQYQYWLLSILLLGVITVCCFRISRR